MSGLRGRESQLPALPPAQIPACGITAPCSSGTLAFASRTAIAASEVGTVDRPCMSGSSVPFGDYVCLSAPSPCARLARLRVLWADRLPRFVGLPTWSFGSGLPVQASPPARNRVGLPSLNVSLPTCRALWRPRSTSRALTIPCALRRLLRPFTHRRLHLQP